jgi:hypothetical protein
MSPQLKEFFEKYITAKRSSPVTMYTKSSEFIAGIDKTMRDIARYGEKDVLERFSKRIMFNKGGEVPGMQYLFGGGLSRAVKRKLDTPSRRSNEVLGSLFREAENVSASQGRKFFSTKNMKDQSLPLISAKGDISDALLNKYKPVYESLIKK